MKPVRVPIVADPATVRRTPAKAPASGLEVEFIGAPRNPRLAGGRIRDGSLNLMVPIPGMRRLDDLALLLETMQQCPTPVTVCSALAGTGADSAVNTLESGAAGTIALSRSGIEESPRQSRSKSCRAAGRRPDGAARRVVLVGASTGGPEALGVALRALPVLSPGLLIVQHMPEPFTAAFARHLDGQCAIAVKEAEDGEPVLPGRALLAPGNRHLLLRSSGGRYFAEVRAGPPVCRHRPSVDVLFRSGARCAGRDAVGVLLTGMGSDGARGLLCLRQAGAATMVQDEPTSEAFAMPHAAIELGAAAEVHPIEGIAPAILEACR